MTVLLKKNSTFFVKFALTLLIIVSSLFVASTTAGAISVSSSANPAWPNKCGIKIGLLIDRSNSISNSDGTTLKNAAKGFVDALAGTSSQIAVAQFRKTATQTLGLTSVFDSAGQTTVKNTIDGYGFGTSDSNGSTNWEAAFYSQQSVAADVVIILTDGNPTQRNIDGSGGNGSSDGSDFNIDAGITRANELKAQGKRVVAVGIGNDVDSTNLAAVSGPTLNSDYFTSSFATLNSKLTEIASTICGGTVTVQKQVKNTDGSYTATNGWDYTATNAVANSKTTAGSGTAEFKYENAPKTTTITETLKSGYVLESISCTKNGNAVGSIQGLGVTLTVNANDIISCIYKNKPTTGKVIVTKQVKNSDGSYTNTNGWDYSATGAIVTSKTTAGSGTAQFDYETTPKATTITETVKGGYSVESVTCLNGNTTVATSTNASVNVTVPTDGTINCYFKNKQDSANLTVKKVATGGNATFGFTSNTALGNFNLTTAGGVAQTSTVAIPVGSFNVSETALAGWTLDGASCTGTTATKSGSQLSFTATKDADIVCTFTNSRDTASLTVVKNAVGGNGTFSFTSNVPTLTNFDLTTDGGTKATPTTVIPTGTYDISEVVPANWTLSGISCNAGSPTVANPKVTITAAKGANITCTFTNTRQTATVTVKKVSIGGNDTFGFTSTSSSLGNFNLTTVASNASTSATTIPAGTSFEVSETAKSGWTLTDLSCTGTNSAIISGNKATITPAVSQNIVCTYTNTRDTGTLIVKKASGSTNGTFSFTSNTPLGNFQLTTVLGVAETSSITVPTGSFSISETVPAGWTLTGSTCTSTNTLFPNNPPVTGVNPGQLTIAKGENIVCTFTNSRDTGTLKVVKNTVGGNGTFSFTSTSGLGSFNLTTVANTASTDVVTVPTGSYDITETVPANWTLANITCAGNSSGSLSGSKATVVVGKGENVVCTYTNTRDTGSIQVVKNTVGGNGTFSFTSNTPLNSFDLVTANNTKSTSVTALDAGTYSITETAKSGWTLTSASCTNAQTSVQGSTVNITVGKNVNVVCTFTNTRDTGTIRIVKNTVGGNGTFNFVADAPVGSFSLSTVGNTATTSTVTVNTGSINLAETVPAGWTLSAISCTGGSADRQGNGVLVEINKGANVVCTFTNTRDQARLQIKKKTVNADADTGFSWTTNTELGNFTLSTVFGTASTEDFLQDTGVYTITENAKTGWSLTDLTCTGATFTVSGTTATVTLTKGANVVCTFTNTRDTGKLQIKKKTVNGDADTRFSWNTNTVLGNFDLSTVNGTASTEQFIQDSGTYTITENAKTGWSLTDLTCTGGAYTVNGTTATVTLVTGANVVCTFTNTRDQGTVTVKKITVGGNGTFSFDTSTPLGDFNLTTVNNNATTATVTAKTGGYSINEAVGQGWTLTDSKCTGGDFMGEDTNELAIYVAKGANVVCTFTNTRDTATIKVVKDVEAAGGVTDGVFTFNSNIDALGEDGDFTLETEGGTASTETVTIPTGNYNIFENVPEGWTLTDIGCTGTEAGEDGGLYLNVAKGDEIVCTFTNTRDTGDVTIVKEVNEAGGVTDGTFNFTSDVPGLENYQITTQDGSGASDAVTVPTGEYNIDEIVPEGWNLDSVSCVDENQEEGDLPVKEIPVPIDAASGSAVVTPGSDIVCTFVNTRETLTLQVVENAINGNDTFPFTLSTSTPVEEPSEGLGGPVSPEALSDLASFSLTTVGGTKSTAVITIPTGTYDLAQLIPTNWTLTSISCVGATNPVVSSPKVSFTGTAGQAIVCTFVNTKTEVLGTVVTRPPDTIVPPQVKGISVGNLPTTGAGTQALLAVVATLIATGLIFFAATKKRKAL